MTDLRERVAEVLASRVWDKSETAAKEVIALIVEECANVADGYAFTISHDSMSDYWAGQGVAAQKIAAAIRALAKEGEV